MKGQVQHTITLLIITTLLYATQASGAFWVSMGGGEVGEGACSSGTEVITQATDDSSVFVRTDVEGQSFIPASDMTLYSITVDFDGTNFGSTCTMKIGTDQDLGIIHTSFLDR